MGHIRLGNLPRTRNWQQVVHLIEECGSISEVAQATLSASKRGLKTASEDIALAHSLWLLTQVTQASREPDFVANLRKLGLSVPDKPTLPDLLGCFSDAVDKELRQRRGRTDLGEMAQLSAVESLTKVCTAKLEGFFGTTTEDVKKAIQEYSTTKGFSVLAHEFFSRLTFRYLSYFLSRELSNHVGGNRRFFNLQEHTEFVKALEVHSRQVSRIIEEFAGGWYSKTTFKGGITQEKTKGFLRIAIKKIISEMSKEG